eukprot:4577086-Prymnesium_polylepis.1
MAMLAFGRRRKKELRRDVGQQLSHKQQRRSLRVVTRTEVKPVGSHQLEEYGLLRGRADLVAIWIKPEMDAQAKDTDHRAKPDLLSRRRSNEEHNRIEKPLSQQINRLHVPATTPVPITKNGNAPALQLVTTSQL